MVQACTVPLHRLRYSPVIGVNGPTLCTNPIHHLKTSPDVTCPEERKICRSLAMVAPQSKHSWADRQQALLVAAAQARGG